MITEHAIVTNCQGSQVELQLQRTSACGGCELSGGCGTGALGRLLGHRAKAIVIETEHQLSPGDRLVLGINESTLAQLSLWVYGIPLLGMLLSGALALWVTTTDGWVALASIGGLLLGFCCTNYLLDKLEATELTPHIVTIQVNPESLTGS